VIFGDSLPHCFTPPFISNCDKKPFPTTTAGFSVPHLDLVLYRVFKILIQEARVANLNLNPGGAQQIFFEKEEEKFYVYGFKMLFLLMTLPLTTSCYLHKIKP